ncbi:hypothetical protein HNY73_008787 [Argiope bruennichi]|uniref:Uncharacterized protein n=1 Tax=Argiope bruennichi TaxID=94029 RepID=A0A8T0FE13_ARGBR|nr:hypothetical protein HNY73_008787 [Argiope bruennichi]
MKTCSVRLNMIKMNVSQDRALMNECKFCDEIFENQYTDSHFETFHPGVSSAENVRKFLVNIHSDPNLKSGSYNNSVVIKIEPESSDYEENASSGFKNSNYLNVNSHPSFNPVLDNISMPPPSVNLPTFQSSVRLPNHQFPSTQVHVPSYTRQEGISNINEQICKCPNRNDASDTKVCLKCLSKLDISEFSQNFKIVPFGLAKIKRENSEESEESNHNAQADFNTATSSTQNGGQGIEIGSGGILDMMSYTSLTPPSSHNGISPPSTPGTLVQSLTNIEPCSASDVSIGSLNDDIAMVPDIAQLDEPRCPDELVHYINDDCSPDIPLIPCDDDQGLFTPMESYKIMHLWDVDDLDCVDAWAVVPSEGNETVEKYICSECIAFSCLDQNSIIKHLIQNHDKKLQFSAMYIIKTENESL